MVSVMPLHYSPGNRRKKKATQVRSLIAISVAVVPWSAMSKAWMMLTGRGLAPLGVESSL